MTCGIYKITNLINNHSYIGLSSNIEKRIKDHIAHAYCKKEWNKPLYCAFRKYGIENFKWEILEECSYDKLKEREIY